VEAINPQDDAAITVHIRATQRAEITTPLHLPSQAPLKGSIESELSTVTADEVGDDSLGDLVQACYAGNQVAFLKLFEQFHGPIWSFVRGCVSCDDDASDITQTVLLRALAPDHEHRWQKGKGASFRTWIYRIANNTLIDKAKVKKGNEKLYSHLSNEDDIEDKNVSAFIPEPQDVEPSTESRLEAIEQTEAIHECINQLPENDRITVRLYMENFNKAKVASIRGLSETRVKQILGRAFETLKLSLRERGIGDSD
jgi:RNA polymerase sigma-70 factor (ECF subfamily)